MRSQESQPQPAQRSSLAKAKESGDHEPLGADRKCAEGKPTKSGHCEKVTLEFVLAVALVQRIS